MSLTISSSPAISSSTAIRLSAAQLTLSVEGRLLCESLGLDLKPGEIWSVLGPNGSGKSTLLRTLAHLQTPTAGEVYLNSEAMKHLKRTQIAQQVGVLFQEIQDPFPVTVYDQVLSGRYPHIPSWSREGETDHALATAAIRTMRLEELKDHLTHHLSGGERQRTAFATLLSQQPQFYLLDEPLNHLDLPFQMLLLEKVRELSQQGRSILMVLHDPNAALQWSSHSLLLYGDGRWLTGRTEDVINKETLSELYRYPLIEIQSPQGRYFVPEDKK